jgi:hypothetical protein
LLLLFVRLTIRLRVGAATLSGWAVYPYDSDLTAVIRLVSDRVADLLQVFYHRCKGGFCPTLHPVPLMKPDKHVHPVTTRPMPKVLTR